MAVCFNSKLISNANSIFANVFKLINLLRLKTEIYNWQMCQFYPPTVFVSLIDSLALVLFELNTDS